MDHHANRMDEAAGPERVGWSSCVGWAPELRKAKVYEQVLLDVILGELAPGGRLDEQALAARYQIRTRSFGAR